MTPEDSGSDEVGRGEHDDRGRTEASDGAAPLTTPRATTAPRAGTAPPVAAAPVRRKSRLVDWLLHDIGLKVLALVIAGVSWYLVRDQIHVELSVPNVLIEIDKPPDSIRLRTSEAARTRLLLVGTVASVERARRGLAQAGNLIRLHLPRLEGDEGEAVFSSPSDFTFPFQGGEVVNKIETPVRFDWYRVESVEVEVGLPEITAPDGTSLVVDKSLPAIDPPRVTVVGPRRLVNELRQPGARLTPDRVDAQRTLGPSPDLATPVTWTCGFSTWRRELPILRTESLVTIEPATVAVKAKFRGFLTKSVNVDLALLYPPGRDADAYRDFDVKILDNGYDARTRRLEVTVRGDPALVTELVAGRSGFTLVVMLPEPPKDATTTVENYKATVLLIPPEGIDGIASAASLKLLSPPKVFVTIARKKS